MGDEGSGASASEQSTGVPAPPVAAGELFADALPAVEEYARLLATEGVVWGLIGPREVPRLWDRHLLNCAAVADLIPHGVSVADLGSGAGLPGIVIALMRADLDVVLIEPLARRTRFLSLCVERLALSGRVRVLRGRAEELGGAVAADIVLARAVAPLRRLAGWAVPLARPGGTVLAIKGRGADDEVRAARRVLRRLGVQSAELVRVGTRILDEPTTVVRLVTGTRRRPDRGG